MFLRSIRSVSDAGTGTGPLGCGSVTISVKTGFRRITIYPDYPAEKTTCFAIMACDPETERQRLLKFDGITGEKLLDADTSDPDSWWKLT